MSSAPNQRVTAKRAAEILELDEREIRAWAKKGLVNFVRDDKNERLFNPDALAALDAKLKGQDDGKFEVLKSDPTDFTAIELFSGCGGLALGFENAGLQTKLLVEIDKGAVATLRKNWPNKEVIDSDVAKVDFRPYRDQIDVVSGGFPCQAFSYAGEGRGFSDTRGTLFFEFARCVKEVRPKIAVGENVRGLIKHDGGRTLETMIGALMELGYRVAFRLLRAQFLDVPQKRERLVIIAVRNDLTDIPILYPGERDYTVSVREALVGVPDSPGQAYPEGKAEVMAQVPTGGNWRDLPEPIQKAFMGKSFYLGGGRTGMARRLAWDEPSLTLTCSPAQKQTERCHPVETRPLTTREYARIQSFPDSWDFEGKTTSIYRQIGNAVPVNLGYHIGRCLVAMLEGQHPESMVEVVGSMSTEPQLTLPI